MKEVWVKADPWRKDLVTTALEGGADAVMVAPQDVKKVRELGVIQTVSDQGDIRWEEDVMVLEIASTKDEDRIVDSEPSSEGGGKDHGLECYPPGKSGGPNPEYFCGSR